MSEKPIVCMACELTPFMCQCEDGPALSLPRAMTLLASEREGWRYADELEQERKRLTAELTAERKRLDWVLDEMGLVELRNLLYLHWDCQDATLRAAIDAAMASDTGRFVEHEESGATP